MSPAVLALALVLGPLAPGPLGLASEPAPPSDWSDFSDFEFVEDADPQSETAPESGTGSETGSETGAEAESDGPRAPRARAGDIMSGSLRLTGAYLHFPDQPAPLPSGSEGLLTTVGRLMVDHSWGRAKLELNLFADMSRVPAFGGLGGAFTSAGQTDSVYRHQYLTVPTFGAGAITGRVGFDRMKVSVEAGPATLEVGRFPINDSVSIFFTPNDYFAPFSATAVNRIYKPGVDAARAAFSIGALSSVELTGVMGFDEGYALAWANSAVMLRASTVQWGFEWSAHGGKVAQRWVAGAGLQGDIGRVGLRAEGHVGIPDADGDGSRRGEAPIHGRLAAGPNIMFDWHSLTLGAEYAFYSEGGASADDYLERAGRFFPDDLPYLARHYVGANLGLEIIPILRASGLALVNASDGSGLAALSAIYSVADEADLIAGLFVPWGRGARATDNPLLPIEVQSEFGNSGLTLYVESRVFF